MQAVGGFAEEQKVASAGSRVGAVAGQARVGEIVSEPILEVLFAERELLRRIVVLRGAGESFLSEGDRDCRGLPLARRLQAVKAKLTGLLIRDPIGRHGEVDRGFSFGEHEFAFPRAVPEGRATGEQQQGEEEGAVHGLRGG